MSESLLQASPTHAKTPTDSAEFATQEFAARAEHLSEMRRLVEDAAQKVGLNRPQISDLLTAVDEAAANAIRYGSPKGAESRVRLRCYGVPGGIAVEVKDEGRGFPVSGEPRMPAPDATGGRGLPLMIALADTFEVASTPHGTTVTLKKMVSSRS
jgi:anti-sigma regulatory factor (Ser/Thr protein kinase)